MTCLREAGITLKISKCTFFSDKIEYLGHIIKPGRLEVDQANTKSLRDARPPKTKSQLRSFLGLVNVYRRFIENFSKVAGPLNKLLKKGSPEKFELDEEQVSSFRALINEVISPKVLALPVPGLPYSVDTDACDYGVGCALFQTHPDGQRKPIGFWSRSLNEAEQGYAIPERECLAVMFALKTLRPYILYEKFVLHTDQESLSWLFNIQDPSGKLLRWRLRLAEFDFEIKYKLGKLNTQADALSRLATDSEAAHEDMEDIPCFLAAEHEEADTMVCLLNDVESTDTDERSDAHEADLCDIRADEVFASLPPPRPNDPAFVPITHEELVTAQLSDSFCQEIRRKLNTGEVRAFGYNNDGLLCRQVSHDQIVVPHVLKARVLHIHHYSRLAAHPGGRRLYYSLRRHMYWPSMAVDCYAIVRKCSTCAKNRIKLRQRSNPLQLFPPAGPLESVAIDVFGPLLVTARGNQYLLMISDRYSKLTKSVPMKSISAEAVARAFTDEWALTYGPPKDLLSDNGGCFNSKFFTSVCTILNVMNKFTTTYHPQTNGQVERYNRTLKAALNSYLDDHPHDWDLYARTLTYAYNCQPHTSTSLAPFELVLSRAPPPFAIQPPSTDPRTPIEYRDCWRHALSKVLKTSGAVLKSTAARMKRNYDERLRRHCEAIKPWDYVFLRVERKDETESRHKLAAVAEGPYKVESVKGNTVVIVYPDAKVERVSKDRVTLAPKSLEAHEIAKLVAPITDQELVPAQFPISQAVNLRDVLAPHGVTGQSPRSQRTADGRNDSTPGTEGPTTQTAEARREQFPAASDNAQCQTDFSAQPTSKDHDAVPATGTPGPQQPPAELHEHSATQPPAESDDNDRDTDCDVTHAVITPPRDEVVTPPPPADSSAYSPSTAPAHPTVPRDTLSAAQPGDTVAAKQVRFAAHPVIHTAPGIESPVAVTQPKSDCDNASEPNPKPVPKRRELHRLAIDNRNTDDQPVGARPRSSRSRRPSRKLRDSDNAVIPSISPRPPEREGGVASCQGSYTEPPAESQESTIPGSWPQEFSIDRIVGARINEEPAHPTADLNESMFKVRWTGYGPKDDTFEPIHHVPRNAVVSYCTRKSIALPHDLSRAQAG